MCGDMSMRDFQGMSTDLEKSYWFFFPTCFRRLHSRTLQPSEEYEFLLLTICKPYLLQKKMQLGIWLWVSCYFKKGSEDVA